MRDHEKNKKQLLMHGKKQSIQYYLENLSPIETIEHFLWKAMINVNHKLMETIPLIRKTDRS